MKAVSCKHIRRLLSRGEFGDTFQAIPDRYKAHIAECRDCGNWLEALNLAESVVSNPDRVMLSDIMLTRMKSNVMKRIEAHSSTRWFAWFMLPRQYLAATAVAGLAFVIILVANLNSPPDTTSPSLTSLQATTLFDESESLDTADPDTLTLAILGEIDTSLIPYLAEELESTDSDLLTESELESFREFQDEDWNALRRYLS